MAQLLQAAPSAFRARATVLRIPKMFKDFRGWLSGTDSGTVTDVFCGCVLARTPPLGRSPPSGRVRTAL